MSTRTDAPIYAQLVHERGDIPEQVRRTAEQTWREVGRTLDFHLPAHDDELPGGPARRRP